jgi:hypothetical protein
MPCSTRRSNLTPLLCRYANWRSLEAVTAEDLAITQLKALKLLVWAFILKFLLWLFRALVYGKLGVPELGPAFGKFLHGGAVPVPYGLFSVIANFPEHLLVSDVQLLKHVGCTFVRGAHYPQDPRFLDLCDERGFLVIDETLRSPADGAVFAAGDIATMPAQPREKAGVYAGRQGPPLADNLRRALAGHHPIVMGFLWVIRAEVVFGYVCEDAQGFRLAGFEELHARVIFPGPERILARLQRILVLSGNERAGISDYSSKEIGPEPAHGQCRSTT